MKKILLILFILSFLALDANAQNIRDDIFFNYGFIKTDNGLFVINNCSKKDYKKISKSLFKDIDKKPYLMWKYGNIVCDWQITIDKNNIIRSYYLENENIFCIEITKNGKLINPFNRGELPKISDEYLKTIDVEKAKAMSEYYKYQAQMSLIKLKYHRYY